MERLKQLKDRLNKSVFLFTHNKWGYIISGAFLGILLFFVIYGPQTLCPTNVAFLYDSGDQDVLSHQLGFDFFRISPWKIPPGLNQFYPYPYDSSVIYSDSIPLFCYIFKFFSPILPAYFQFFGIWILFCFVMQAICAILLLRKLNVDYWTAVAATPFFICNVPLLFRCFHHSALAGQWIILFCFLLLLYEDRLKHISKLILWCFACGISIWIHGYLFIMVGTIMSFSMLYESIKEHTVKKSGITFLTCVAISVLCYYLGGGFVTTSNTAMFGLGLFNFDITDLINPDGFSSFFPALPILYQPSERSAYMGLGIFLLLIYTLILLMVNKQALKRIRPHNRLKALSLLIISFVFLLLSIGISVRFAGKQYIDLCPLLSEKALSLLSNFRANGRFIWPVWYLSLLFLILLIHRLSKSHKITFLFLILCVFLQYADVVPATALGKAEDITDGYPSAFCTALDTAFTADAKHLSFIGPIMHRLTSPAVFAAHHNMTLNSSKVGRGVKNSVAEDIERWNKNLLLPDTIYVIPMDSLFYVDPIRLSDDYAIVLCDEYICVFYKALLNADFSAGNNEFTYLSSDNLYEMLVFFNEQYKDMELYITDDEM